MGRRISIDSATMVNKGLEMIEARWLFDLKPEQISAVIHPQSTVHSMVEFIDGSIIAQIGKTDMAMPIQHSLSYPERWQNEKMHLDLPQVGELTFFEPDTEKFPALELAQEVLLMGGTMGAVFNAADEVAVEAFLNGKIAFPQIVKTVAAVMDAHLIAAADTLETVMAADKWARISANNFIEGTE
jgi:1-deoxy-D-xylulose-5-phosphate reductoisomerase